MAIEHRGFARERLLSQVSLKVSTGGALSTRRVASSTLTATMTVQAGMPAIHTRQSCV